MDIFDNLPLLLNFLFFTIGVVVLVKGSDFFIDSSVFFARKFNVSEVVIGLTLVSIGTSLPELAANIKRETATPVAAGFGISSPEQVRRVCSAADGVIIGSSILDAFICGKQPFDLIRSFKEATCIRGAECI